MFEGEMMGKMKEKDLKALRREDVKENNWEISENTAICLYVAIMTDTGNFRFENTSSDALRAAADLIDYGANPNILYKKCYETKTKNDLAAINLEDTHYTTYSR